MHFTNAIAFLCFVCADRVDGPYGMDFAQDKNMH